MSQALHRKYSGKTATLECVLAGLMLAWGVVLLLPGDTFSLGKSYAILASIAGEVVWGIFSVLIGTIRLAAVVFNGQIFGRRTPIFRLLGALFGVCWWVLLWSLFLAASVFPVPGGVGFYPVLLGAELYVSYCCGRDIHESHALFPLVRK